MPILIALLACLFVPLPLAAEYPTKGAFPSSKPLDFPPAAEGRKTFKKKKSAKPAESVQKLKAAAVLLSNANIAFTTQTEWTGGAENYKREMNELVDVLKKQGVGAELITDDQIRADGLWKYRSLYILDTFSIDRRTCEKIRDFVRGGGLLVGISEVGRFQNGNWVPRWPYEEVFGLKTMPVDEWGSGVTNDGFLYRQAAITADGGDEALTKGLEGKIDFGPLSSNVWATKSAGAKVLAEFPKHLKTVAQTEGHHKFETVDEPVAAVTLNRFGNGAAIFIAPLVGGRKPGRLADVSDLAMLLKNAQAYASDRVEMVTPPPAEPVLAYSQAGYLPGQQKQAVLVLDGAASAQNPKFTVRGFPSGKKILDGKCAPVARPFWQSKEWIADFSRLRTEGSYWIEVEWTEGKKPHRLQSEVFKIDPILYRLDLIPSQISFFHENRCGNRCHADSPLPGGYHDATGDWSVRMWSMPAVVYGLARYLEVDPSSSDSAREELAWALDWCLKMQGENGEVWAGVVPPKEKSETGHRPWEEKAARTVQKSDSQGNRLVYIAAMARAAKALKSIDAGLSDKALAAAAKTWELTRKEIGQDPGRLGETGDMGNWIWANMQLHRATGEAKYLDEAKTWAPRQIERQHRDPGGVADTPVCGDFFDSVKKDGFGRHQYKTFHQLGIYAGLIDLHAALQPSDPLWWPVHAALERLLHGYFKPMASVTPYGLVGKALERDQPTDPFRILFFDNTRAWEGAHFGYNSDYLAEGLMALDYGRQTGQPEVVDFAEDQVEWILGNNPLGYSMVDGIGSRIAPMIDDAVGTGRIFGGIPNGYIGEGKENFPIWGEGGTNWWSREYWLPHNAFFLPLIAELQWKRNIPEPDVPFGWNVERGEGAYRVTVPEGDRVGRQFELLADGGSVASDGEGAWTVTPAAGEPLVLLLRDAQKPEIYRQKFIMKP